MTVYNAIIAKYSKYNLWRKPEVQVPGIFNYEEMLRLNDLWQSLVVRCEALREQIPTEAQDAFYNWFIIQRWPVLA